MPRYLNLSELAHVRWLASEAMRRRRPHRPRRARRVRAYAPAPRTLALGESSRSPLPPRIPAPRRPLDSAPMDVLQAVLAGLRRLGVAA
ncbi:hypothetical protein GCM10009642_13550 [Nocardiopsis metallicus]|uniref:Uncharacterized protein n=1 Tax=Nocardiopsis metallicus TaxID=179819 RepID=A0A840W8X5_9ACTN|nr:hypothetical protein [Nocardiopsis metallicus]